MTKKRPASKDVLTVRNARAPARRSTTGSLGRRLAAPAHVRPNAVAPVPVRADSLLVVLWRSRWVMLVCLLLAIDGGIAYLQNVTPIYTSTAKLYLDDAGMRISNPYDPVGQPQTDKYLCTQAEIVKSRPILDEVENTLVPRRLRTLADVDVPIAFLQENLLVEIGKKDLVISISLSSPYAAEAAEIVNGVVDAYLADRTKHGQRDSAQVLRILEDELRLAGNELTKKRDQLAEFRRDDMPLALGSDQGNGVTPRYLELQTAHTQAQIKMTAAEEFRKAVQMRAQDPVALRQYLQLRGNNGMFAATDQEKASLEARLIELRRTKDGLQGTLTVNVPKVAALNREMNQIEAQLQGLDHRFVQAIRDAAEQQYVEAKGNEERLAQLCREQQGQVVLLNAEVAHFQRLRSEEDQLAAHCQMLEQKVREARTIVGEDVDQWRMAELERALPSALPSTPQPVRVMAMALILGLLLGGGVAVTRDWLDQTLHSTDEISAVLRVPVLGIVPAMSRRRRMPERGRKVLLQPDSHEAEAFRTIRTAVLFGAAPQGAKTLLITSPAAGEGKSTLVSNLAIALANAGQKTLILDADLRRPVQHVIFGLDPRERCLGDVFAGTMTLAAAVRPTGIERLHILTGGYGVSNPAEVLNSQQFAHLLTGLADVYDRIVVDAPPVTVVTDAQILGALCDATVLVLRADKSVRTVALRAVDALQSVGARLLGVVVNEVRKGGHRYGYYYHRDRKYYNSEARRRAGTAKSDIPVAAVGASVVKTDAPALPVGTTSEGA